MTAPNDLPDWDTRVSPGVDVLLSTLTLPVGGVSPNYDVGVYTAIIISITDANLLTDLGFIVGWLDKDGQQIQADNITLFAGPTEESPFSAQIPARAATFNITNYGPVPANLDISGSNRPTSGLTIAGFADITNFANPPAAMAVGAFYPIGNVTHLRSQGWHQMEFSISGTTVGGSVYLQFAGGASVNSNMMLASTAQALAVGSNRHYCGQVILPAQPCNLRFFCEVAGTASLTVNLAALGH